MKEEQTDRVGRREGRLDLQNCDRREANKLIAALALFGMGLGVNLEEAFAGLTQSLNDVNEQGSPQQGAVEQPSADSGKKVGVKQGDVLQPSVGLGKKGDVEQPSVDLGKKVDVKQGVAAPVRPGVTRAKPVPANMPQGVSNRGQDLAR